MCWVLRASSVASQELLSCHASLCREAQRRKERVLREKRAGGGGGGTSLRQGDDGAGGGVRPQDSGSLPPHPLEGYGFPQIGVEQSVDAFDAYVRRRDRTPGPRRITVAMSDDWLRWRLQRWCTAGTPTF